MIGSPLHRAARALAKADIPIFPCVVDGKQPATPNGFKDATCDAAQIDAWWSVADYNLALCPEDAGWFAIDCDVKGDGNNTWAKLKAEQGEISTYCNRTPSLGNHYIFAGTGPTSARKLGPGVDTRGVGGYILWPPSMVEGKPYRNVCADKPAPLPEWVTAKLAEGAVARTEAADVDLDLPANVRRAMADIADHKLAFGDPAPSDGGSNAYGLATKLRDKGLSDEKIVELMSETWAPHFDREWVETIVTNAGRYAQNARGVDAVEPAANVIEFAAYATAHPVAAKDAGKKSRFYPENPAEQDEHPAPSWLLPDLLPSDAIALVFGLSGSFKTYLMLDWALSIANNVPTAFGIAPVESGAVFYGALEGRHEIASKRRKAWELQHGIETKDYPFYLLPAPYISSDDQCSEFIEELAKRLNGRPCRAIFIDTVFKAMTGLKLTSDEHGGLFVAFCQTLKEKFGCAVVAIHHPSKGDASSAFGSYTLVAGFDSVAKVERIPKTLHTTFTVEQHRDAAEPAEPYRFKGRVLGPSLVFDKVEAQAHALVEQGHDPLSRVSVGNAIRNLGAIDVETGVTTHVVASHLAQIEPGEPDERHRERIAETSRKLGSMASKTLAAYCDRSKGSLLWFLPAKAA